MSGDEIEKMLALYVATEINEKTFPDSAFREYVKGNLELSEKRIENGVEKFYVRIDVTEIEITSVIILK